jgi:hypothetical protein
MSTVFDTYLPFSSGAGSNVTESQWEDLAEQWFPSGVVFGYTNGLAVSARGAGANLSVDVATGQCRVRGHEGISTSIKNLAITPNLAGNPRIDLVVARADLTAKTVALDVLVGTAAANPVEPALTQNSSLWEIALGAVFVAASNPSSVTDIRDRRTFVRSTVGDAWKEPVRAATATAMAASTATATTRVANANGALAAVDGVTLVAGDRILDKDNATGAARGIWTVVDVGSASQPWRLERPADASSYPFLRSGSVVKVTEGATNVGTEWVLTTANPLTIGTTALTFTQAGSSSSFNPLLAQSFG